MTKKVLVAYATRYGSTKDIADKIAQILTEDGYDADSKNILDITQTDEYGAVIAGSAIQMGKWLPEAKDFMQTFKSHLNRVPLFVFSCGITLNKPDENVIRKAYFSTDEIKQYVSPKETGLFAGKLDTSLLSDSDKDLVVLAKPECGDFRDYDEVKKWVLKIESEYLR
ncbi:flavodoxin domain-containing protein [Methanomicrobium antiquum]|uniref:Flavodoxin domain-containing protein n=1 Tax=Methanomicrobium antiquum TaxID=487686 RepID=A0AAF0FTX8_9EURY|nr:flavodoxin domain-containing protein [Methanomicrobium antiquum]WFN35855.1 flavodoxin domain-containing protein [Methanomicrobium antiquum]